MPDPEKENYLYTPIELINKIFGSKTLENGKEPSLSATDRGFQSDAFWAESRYENQIVGLDNQIKYIKKHIISACKNRSFTKEELKLGHVNDIDHILNKGNRTLALLRILKQDIFGGEIMNGIRSDKVFCREAINLALDTDLGYHGRSPISKVTESKQIKTLQTIKSDLNAKPAPTFTPSQAV